MEFTREELRQKLYESALNYPDLEAMVTAGQLIRKGRKYHPTSQAAADALVGYCTAVLVDKEQRGWYTISRQLASMKKLAAELRAAGHVNKLGK